MKRQSRPGSERLVSELSRHDWSGLRSFIGDASFVPNAIMALASARSETEAMNAYWRIDNVVMVDGRLSEFALSDLLGPNMGTCHLPACSTVSR